MRICNIQLEDCASPSRVTSEARHVLFREGEAPSQQDPPRSIPRRAIWNLAIGIAGVGYILLALCLNVQSPLFATVFVAAAASEVIGSHSGRRHP
jgi:hypothetical protein